jgi:hypothetical protein
VGAKKRKPAAVRQVSSGLQVTACISTLQLFSSTADSSCLSMVNTASCCRLLMRRVTLHTCIMASIQALTNRLLDDSELRPQAACWQCLIAYHLLSL